MTERERAAVQDLRRRLLTDPRKPLATPFGRSLGSGDDHAMLDLIKLSGFTMPDHGSYRTKEA